MHMNRLPLVDGSLTEAYPRGQFLADGAYKRVYKVLDAQQ